MRKVCHMTSAHQGLDVRIFYKECLSLANSGYEVYLVAQGDSFEKDGVHIVGVGRPPVSRLKRMTQTAKRVYEKALKLDADIYHFHDPELLPYGLKLKKRGKKVIFDSHENYTMQIAEKGYIPKFIRSAVTRMFHSYETHVVKHLDAVIIPCTFEGKNIFDGRAKQTVFISNSPVLSEFYDKYSERTEKENSICYVGVLAQSRGITHLIKAASIANTKLILAGKFHPVEYSEKVKAMPEYENVEYKGYINRDEVVRIYNQAAFGACTLLRKGQYDKLDTFSIKVCEYMSMGLPLIITNYPYAREVLREYKFGICVEPDDVDDMANAIEYLLENPEAAKIMGEEGRRAVWERFNWGVEEKKLLALYEDIVEKKHPLLY